MKRNCLYIAILILLGFQAHSQSLSVFDIDTTSFPTMKAKFFAFDTSGALVQGLSTLDFVLTENGTARKILSVSCPPEKPKVRLSSVIVIDVSGSMGGSYYGSPLSIAQTAAKTFVNALPLGQSDCAVTSFDNSNYFNQDFTTNRNKLISAIDAVGSGGGTDYNMAMVEPVAGGILVAKVGKHSRMVIFITDGQPNQNPDVSRIIAEANADNITIHCITIGQTAHSSMVQFAKKTGGLCFDNVTTEEQAKVIANQILGYKIYDSPCEISWESGINCQSGLTKVNLVLPSMKLSDTKSYISPASSIVKLEVFPQTINFRNIIPSNQKDTIIKVTCRNGDYTISDITSTNPSFTIKPTNFTLKPGESKDLTISYLAVDSGYVFTQFDFINNLCPCKYFSSGTFYGKKPKKPTLKLTSPNGGEKFVIGRDTIITWEGISKPDTVKLEYTTDNGTNWKQLSNQAFDWKYSWNNIPRPVSDSCKVRVKQGAASKIATTPGVIEFELIDHTNVVNCISWSPDCNRVATASMDNTAIIWSTSTGDIVVTLSGHTGSVNNISWSPDGTRVVSVSTDKSAVIWDAGSGSILHKLIGHNYSVITGKWNLDGIKIATSSWDKTTIIWDATTGQKQFTLAGHDPTWSPDGTLIATATSDSLVVIWDAATGQKIQTLVGHVWAVIDMSWSADAKQIATASVDNDAIIWDVKNGVILNTLKGHTSSIYSITWSPDCSKLATASVDRTAIIWDAATGTRLYTLTGHTGTVNNVVWDPNGKRLATSSVDYTSKIWNAETGQELYTLKGHTGFVNDVFWNNDGDRVATSSYDHTGKIWYVGTINNEQQIDESDQVFSIVAPTLTSHNIDMGKVLLGSYKDSLITSFVRNIGSYDCIVKDIKLKGADSADFYIISNRTFTLKPGEIMPIEFHFQPKSLGQKNVIIEIESQDSILIQKIAGEGVQPQVEILSKLVDFGIVAAGAKKDTIIFLITNKSSFLIDITATKLLGPDLKQFEVITGGGTFPLAAGESRELKVRFKPIFIGRTSSELGFYFNGPGSPARVKLYGMGIGGQVYMTKDSALAGEQRVLKLIMSKVDPDGIASIAFNFDAKIRFQNSILTPVEKSDWTIASDSVFIILKGSIGSTLEIAEIPVVSGLGNVEETSVDILEMNLYDKSGTRVDYDFDLIAGSFKLLGLCYEGGKRLFSPSGKAEMLSINPNPAGDELNITLNAIEAGETNVIIYNLIGNEIMRLKVDTQTSGRKELNVNISDFSNGIYLIKYQTPTWFEYLKLVIRK